MGYICESCGKETVGEILWYGLYKVCTHCCGYGLPGTHKKDGTLFPGQLKMDLFLREPPERYKDN